MPCKKGKLPLTSWSHGNYILCQAVKMEDQYRGKHLSQITPYFLLSSLGSGDQIGIFLFYFLGVIKAGLGGQTEDGMCR